MIEGGRIIVVMTDAGGIKDTGRKIKDDSGGGGLIVVITVGKGGGSSRFVMMVEVVLEID